MYETNRPGLKLHLVKVEFSSLKKDTFLFVFLNYSALILNIA